MDIERGAVDIARLRFWLSLIVDEETPQALPNLDFKIMQGNSLLEQYKGVDLSKITELKQDKVGTYQTTMFDDMLDVLRHDLRKKLDEYYNCPDHKRKAELKQGIINNVKQQLKEQSISVDFGDLDLSGNNQFMLWHTWFYDVFSKGGFDIVIGNPPYVFARNSEEKGMSQEEKDIYYKKFALAKYQINLYHLFVEQGVSLLNKKGTFAFIIPNNWMTINTNKDFRKYILSKSCIKITNFYKKVFENADVDSSILVFCNSCGDSTVLLKEAVQVDKIETISKTTKERLLSNKDYIINIELYKSNSFVSIIDKIEGFSIMLNCLSDVKAGLKAYEVGKGVPIQTKEMKKDRVYHSKIQIDESYFRYIDGNDVKRYILTWERQEYLKYGENLAAPRKNWALYSSPRILVRQIPSKPPYCINACFTDEVILNDMNSMNIINIRCNPLYLLAVLNSRLISFWFAHKFGKLQRGLFPQFKINELASFPIPSCSSEQEEQLTDLARKIMFAKKNDFLADTSALESEIDHIVYKIFGLTEKEIRIVEGK